MEYAIGLDAVGPQMAAAANALNVTFDENTTLERMTAESSLQASRW